MNWFKNWPFRSMKFVKNALKQWYSISGVAPQFNDYSKDVERLAVALSNPALLKVIALQCDLFSQAKFYVYRTAGSGVGKEKLSDPALDRLNAPNYVQGSSQFLWDVMFWWMLRDTYIRMESNVVERDNAPMYVLVHHKMDWPYEIEKYKDKLILSQRTKVEVDKLEVRYNYDDGSSVKIPLGKILHLPGLTNGIGNWWKSPSRIDALTKQISNFEYAQDSKNINIRYAGKFIVAGSNDASDVKKTPMSEGEKQSIEERMDSDDKKVHAMKSMAEIRRFVDDLKAMPLDEAAKADFFMIGSMYNIPRDVLEIYTSSTYENQEKARAGHVAYTLDPVAHQFGTALAKYWGYDTGEARLRREIVLSWDHLPFVQVFEKDRMAVKNQKITTFTSMLKAGIPLEECNAFLDTTFTIDEQQRDTYNPKPANGQSGAGKRVDNSGGSDK